MRSSPPRNFRKRLTVLGLLAALTIGSPPARVCEARTPAQTNQAGKVSPDLRQKLGGAGRVDVIVQFDPSDRSLDSAVNALGGCVTRSYRNFSARAVNLPASAVEALSRRPNVRFISPDRGTAVLGHVTKTTGADAARGETTTTSTQYYDGSGVGIAVLDSGVDAAHRLLANGSGATRVALSLDFTGEGRTDDPYGHGSHVAGVAAANDNVSSGAYQGIAPDADLVNLRVLNSRGTGTLSGILFAMDWVLSNRAAYNIRVVNLSLGTEAVDSYRNDPLCRAARKLVDAGVVVVAAAGNQGKDSSGRKIYGLIHSPGIDPSVITVGASNSFGTDSRADDAVATYSSRGPTRGYYTDLLGVRHCDNLVKPDLVAPGNRLIDPQSPDNYLVTNNPSLDANVSGSPTREHMYLSGTSMATPAVAGAAALMLQANPRPTPNLVKAILMYTAQPLAGFNMFEQGGGQLNVEGDPTAAMAAAFDPTIDPPAAPTTLTVAVVSTTQLNMSWKDLSADEQGFVIERCAGSTCTDFAQIAQVGAGITSFQNTGLTKATTYRYRMRAFHPAVRSDYSNTASATTKSR